METEYRCVTNEHKGKIIIKSIPEREYMLSFKDVDDENVENLGDLSLDDITELAEDMLKYVKIMRREVI